MTNSDNQNYSWVKTYEALVRYLAGKRDKQSELLSLLKSVGIGPLNDRDETGRQIPLSEIDPFSFFCYLNKYGSRKRTELLRKIAEKLRLPLPDGDTGLPSANPQQVWLFPYKEVRKNNEINRLWDFFFKARNNQITDEDFQDVMMIKGVGLAKITEGLFYISPENYMPINGPVIPYLRDKLGVAHKFKSFSEYKKILNQVKEKTELPFYQISYEAWEFSSGKSCDYWVFQCNPDHFDIENALRDGAIDDWTVTAHKNEIKPGDKAILWVTGKNAGCYGLAEVTSPPKQKEQSSDDSYWKTNSKNGLKAGIEITHNWLENPILKEKVFEIEELKDLNAGKQGTNFSATEDQYLALLALVRKETNNVVNHPLNNILYGPPGTGKTYRTIKYAAEIVSGHSVNDYQEAKRLFNEKLGDQIEFITFHQNYAYEDFIQGLRPETENGNGLTFEKKDGIFKRIADRALKNLNESSKPDSIKLDFEEVFNQLMEPLLEGDKKEIKIEMKRTAFHIIGLTEKSIEFRKTQGSTDHTLSITTLKKMYEAESCLSHQGLSSYYKAMLDALLPMGKNVANDRKNVKKKNYVLIIDEINRANISRVFGELITLIESDKRSHGDIPLSCILPSGDKFIVPSNLYILGTMNTADKSIALLDIALRRRFDFEPMYPVYEIDGGYINDTEILRKLNEQLEKVKGYDFQIGHTYFMENTGEVYSFSERMNRRVIPLLMEYFMNDKEEVVRLLKNSGVNVEDNSWPIKVANR